MDEDHAEVRALRDVLSTYKQLLLECRIEIEEWEAGYARRRTRDLLDQLDRAGIKGSNQVDTKGESNGSV